MATVAYERVGNVGVIKLNRPQVLNAINEELITDLLAALEVAKKDKAARAFVLKGEGRAFCAGADLKEIAVPTTIDQYYDRIENIQDISRRIVTLNRPIIAAIQGYALGAGCEIAIDCDIRIAAQGAKLGFPEMSVGATVSNGGTRMLAKLVGTGRAKEMIYTSEMVDAEKAEQWGLVNKVVPLPELDKYAMQMANKIANMHPITLRVTRLCIDQAMDSSFDAVLETETLASIVSRESGERKGVVAPSERRKKEEAK